MTKDYQRLSKEEKQAYGFMKLDPLLLVQLKRNLKEVNKTNSEVVEDKK